MINKRKFGNAAKKISVEECIKGEELSVFAICDGENYQFQIETTSDLVQTPSDTRFTQSSIA